MQEKDISSVPEYYLEDEETPRERNWRIILKRLSIIGHDMRHYPYNHHYFRVPECKRYKCTRCGYILDGNTLHLPAHDVIDCGVTFVKCLSDDELIVKDVIE